eukprot:Sspe_Gene.7006::Locus_2354_Transcript_2_2_Confidence_0.667_Length_1721::g.7006::m.7006/K19613/SHOC2, SUR8; leucine-rich repeat protein SHOC2
MPGKRKGGGDPREAFWNAVANQKMDTIRWSLSNLNGLEASTQNEDGITSMMLAVKLSKPQSLNMLIDFYARQPLLRERGWVECCDNDGKTALMMAAEQGNEQMLDALLEAQPLGRGERSIGPLGHKLLEQKCKKGWTARDYAVKNKKQNVVEYIDEWLKPPEEAEEQGAATSGGLSSTQQSKLKKRALLAAVGDTTIEERIQKEKEREELAKQQREEEEKAEKARKERGPPAWPEVEKVESTIGFSSKVCEVTIIRPERGPDCPVRGDEENPCDPCLWHLPTLNRLQLKLPEGLLRRIPPEVRNLQALQILILSDNALESLPDEIGHLTALRVLEAENNAIQAFPPSLSKCTQLEVVRCGRNRIPSVLPLKAMKNLTTVALDFNLVTTVELDFPNLPRLADVSFQGNQLTEIPEEIGAAQALQRINFSSNKIKEVPSEITALKKIKELQLQDNPLSDSKVKRYLEGGGKGLKDLWKYLEKTAAKPKKGGKKGKKKKGGGGGGSDEDEGSESD